MENSARYLIIGNGRLARHLIHYFALLNVNVLTWSRSKDTTCSLKSKSSQVSHILICTKDSAIEEIANYEILANKTKLHFSGCLALANCHSIHPLMTFTEDLYPAELYPRIPLILDEKTPDLKQLIPEFNNPVYWIEEELRPLYHALCVSGGNFTTILWQKVFKESFKKLNLPQEAYAEFLKVTVANILKAPDSALTGPLARSDLKTIKMNKESLKNSCLLLIYEAFEKAYAVAD